MLSALFFLYLGDFCAAFKCSVYTTVLRSGFKLEPFSKPYQSSFGFSASHIAESDAVKVGSASLIFFGELKGGLSLMKADGHLEKTAGEATGKTFETLVTPEIFYYCFVNALRRLGLSS